MARRKKVKEDTNLQTLTNVGDIVEIIFHPIGKIYANYVGEPDLPPEEIVARVNGKFRGVVTATTVGGICVSSREDDGYHNGYELEWRVDEISHIQIIGSVPQPERASFGTLSMTYDPNDKSLTANGRNITKELVSAVAAVRGYTYPGDKTTDSMRKEHWLDGIKITPNGLEMGCASCTLKELDKALDWCATHLWGYEG